MTTGSPPRRPRRRRVLGILLAALGALVALPGAASGQRAGTIIPAPGAERIVSLVPAATESLFAMGAGERVVGVSSHAVWPPAVKDLPTVGALIDPDAERIVALEPRLVVLDPSQRGLRRQLEAMGIASYAWETGNIEALYRRTLELGRLVGAAAGAEDLVGEIRAGLDAVRERVAGRSEPRVLLVFGRRPGSFAELWVSGGVGFLHQLLDVAGGRNLFGEHALPGLKASIETLVAEPPDVVIEVVDPATPAIRAAVAEQWRGLPGFAEVRVGVLDGSRALIPGPRIVATARSIAEILHPPTPADGAAAAAEEVSRRPW